MDDANRQIPAHRAPGRHRGTPGHARAVAGRGRRTGLRRDAGRPEPRDCCEAGHGQARRPPYAMAEKRRAWRVTSSTRPRPKRILSDFSPTSRPAPIRDTARAYHRAHRSPLRAAGQISASWHATRRPSTGASGDRLRAAGRDRLSCLRRCGRHRPYSLRRRETFQALSQLVEADLAAPARRPRLTAATAPSPSGGFPSAASARPWSAGPSRCGSAPARARRFPGAPSRGRGSAASP